MCAILGRYLPNFLEYACINISGIVDEDIHVAVYLPCFLGFGVERVLGRSNVELENGGARIFQGRETVDSASSS